MKPLVSCIEAKQLDMEWQQKYLLSDDVLMEAAAIAMVQKLRDNSSFVEALATGTIVAYCGRGNNGGDALAILRRLALAGKPKLVACVESSPNATTQKRLNEAKQAGVLIIDSNDEQSAIFAKEASFILDAITGIGYKGPEREAFLRLKNIINSATCPVTAIDLPSGLDPSQSLYSAQPALPIQATCTLCVSPLKLELFYDGIRPYAGKIIAIDDVFGFYAGNNSGKKLITFDDIKGLNPELDIFCHKGERGSLAIFAGALGTSGAAVLAGRSASASGAGSVTMLVDDAVFSLLSSVMISQMVRPANNPGTRHFDAILLGPGWGQNEANLAQLKKLLDSDIPLVLDADALHLLAKIAESKRPVRQAPLVLTPHIGEFIVLADLVLGCKDNKNTARFRTMYDTASILNEVASFFGAIIVLKSAVTWIAQAKSCNTEYIAILDEPNPFLATAGSGDVLSGLIAGYMARGMEAWNAAKLAVLCHSKAGTMAKTQGFYEAGELIPHIASISALNSVQALSL